MKSENEKHFLHARERIPWATQTNAKRQNPAWGAFMPPFIERAKGCRMWDLDGREFIDYRCALGPIILGYGFAEVDEAVREQMQRGVLFSMASPLELETAEAIIRNVSWVEQVRFMKTGADACTACVRLARAYTGREHILTAGYHGYHDTFALNWPTPGVPEVLREYVHDFQYNDLEAIDAAFEQFGSQLAAVIVEPYDWGLEIGNAFLQKLRQKCDEYGTVLIFDEVLTGFRLALGGAQAYFGVTPDLAAFAKAMANGYPVSAFAGKKQFMQQLEKTIITTTYAGETLSLAACRKTMDILSQQPVHEHIFKMGDMLKAGFADILTECGLPASAAGVPAAPFIHFESADEQKNLDLHNRLFAKLFENGIFANERWFINFSHQPLDIEQTLEALRRACRML